jgi:hypothetical protein
MAATISFYNNWAEAVNDVALRSATLKATLHSSSYTFSATDSVYASLTNELSTANGYTSGGVALSSVSWDQSSGTATLDAADTEWTANGGTITARRAVVRAIGTFNSQEDPLLFSVLMNDAPADVEATSGNKIILQWHASGIFTLGFA